MRAISLFAVSLQYSRTRALDRSFIHFLVVHDGATVPPANSAALQMTILVETRRHDETGDALSCCASESARSPLGSNRGTISRTPFYAKAVIHGQHHQLA
ncbi:hypothetical protein CC86DRAFT_155254 [Ophiobolus disseminans]|uniref:Uncharacterized protein n=1 Tax=Ophiobolus disseminans TaxID=1469910 RepID=A0A6A6ZCE9_9PLEO|nr:hypothetical protein CC86DRAFT_155254 [Ophiobolus disseminans]